jgi:hypothetical protein
MKNPFLYTGIITIFLASIMLFSCKKTIENHYISKAYVPPVNGITTTTLGHVGSLPTAYSGTLLANTTYTVVGDIEILPGDTIFVQPGVTVCVEDTSCIIVKGALVSIGTQTNPIVFTDCAVTPNNSFNSGTIAQTEMTDPAWNMGNGWWSGIQCDTSCTLLLLKWTQVWFTGAPFHRTEPVANTKDNGTSYGIFFQRTNGNFIMEDCKMYCSVDDAVRISEGQFEVMRSVFEKMGYQGGDNVNIKSGGVGDFAYNLCVGNATNSSKASNKGGNVVQCNVCMYNNTYIDGGWRNQSSGVGSDIDFEQGAEGAAYNNIIVNCRIGLRIVGSPVADTTNMYYGYNFIYGDSVIVTSQFYPNPAGVTKLNAYIAPIPVETGYVYIASGSGMYNSADAAALCKENNPMFVNFPLPQGYPMGQVDNCEPTQVEPAIYASVPGPGFNFHLTSSSPCKGTGTTTFQSGYPINACASVSIPKLPNGFSPASFVPDESPPCSDMGCYPYSNTAIGNQQ